MSGLDIASLYANDNNNIKTLYLDCSLVEISNNLLVNNNLIVNNDLSVNGVLTCNSDINVNGDIYLNNNKVLFDVSNTEFFIPDNNTENNAGVNVGNLNVELLQNALRYAPQVTPTGSVDDYANKDYLCNYLCSDNNLNFIIYNSYSTLTDDPLGGGETVLVYDTKKNITKAFIMQDDIVASSRSDIEADAKGAIYYDDINSNYEIMIGTYNYYSSAGGLQFNYLKDIADPTDISIARPKALPLNTYTDSTSNFYYGGSTASAFPKLCLTENKEYLFYTHSTQISSYNNNTNIPTHKAIYCIKKIPGLNYYNTFKNLENYYIYDNTSNINNIIFSKEFVFNDFQILGSDFSGTTIVTNYTVINPTNVKVENNLLILKKTLPDFSYNNGSSTNDYIDISNAKNDGYINGVSDIEMNKYEVLQTISAETIKEYLKNGVEYSLDENAYKELTEYSYSSNAGQGTWYPSITKKYTINNTCTNFIDSSGLTLIYGYPEFHKRRGLIVILERDNIDISFSISTYFVGNVSDARFGFGANLGKHKKIITCGFHSRRPITYGVIYKDNDGIWKKSNLSLPINVALGANYVKWTDTSANSTWGIYRTLMDVSSNKLIVDTFKNEQLPYNYSRKDDYLIMSYTLSDILNTNKLDIFNGNFNRIITNTIQSNNNLVITSDDRYKINETIINNGLEIINKLTAKKYIKTQFAYDASYNGVLKSGDKGIIESGFIAQELLDISNINYVVTYSNDKYGVKYNDLFVYGIAAIKELNNLIENRELKIISLNNENKKLNDDLNIMKDSLNKLLIIQGKSTI